MSSVKESLDYPHFLYREMVVEIKTQDNSIKQLGSPYKLSETPVRFEMPPPRLGEHTDELLQEAGYDAAQIAEMRETGAVL